MKFVSTRIPILRGAFEPEGPIQFTASAPAHSATIVTDPMPEQLPLEITPQDVKLQLDAAENIRLIDVRETTEHNICRIEGAELIPMNTIPQRLAELSAQSEKATLIVFCHHGGRSLNVVNWLRRQGVAACRNLTGGIDRWSLEIDPNVPRY